MKTRGKKINKRRLKRGIHNISKQDIRRCARRGGVMRINNQAYDEAKLALYEWLDMVIKKTYVYTLHARRRTVSKNDVIYGLKSCGITLYN